MFLRSLAKLNDSISFRNLPPNSGADQKQWSLLRSSSISVRNFGFLVAKCVLLAKKPRRPDIFCPFQCQN